MNTRTNGILTGLFLALALVAVSPQRAEARPAAMPSGCQTWWSHNPWKSGSSVYFGGYGRCEPARTGIFRLWHYEGWQWVLYGVYEAPVGAYYNETRSVGCRRTGWYYTTMQDKTQLWEISRSDRIWITC